MMVSVVQWVLFHLESSRMAIYCHVIFVTDGGSVVEVHAVGYHLDRLCKQQTYTCKGQVHWCAYWVHPPGPH